MNKCDRKIEVTRKTVRNLKSRPGEPVDSLHRRALVPGRQNEPHVTGRLGSSGLCRLQQLAPAKAGRQRDARPSPRRARWLQESCAGDGCGRDGRAGPRDHACRLPRRAVRRAVSDDLQAACTQAVAGDTGRPAHCHWIYMQDDYAAFDEHTVPKACQVSSLLTNQSCRSWRTCDFGQLLDGCYLDKQGGPRERGSQGYDQD
jgi:hypothetical protein